MNLSSLFQLPLNWVVRILLAALMGSLIGLERQTRSKGAGMGTHAIVCIAACALTIVSKYGFYDVDKVDAARLAAQIISGISFLGAGIIFVRNENVQGLTTAAGVFATAGIGISFGAGLCAVGLLTGCLVILFQYVLHHVRHTGSLSYETRIAVTLKEGMTDISDIVAVIRKHNSHPGKISISEADHQRVLETNFVTSKDSAFDSIIREIKELPNVAEVSLRKKQ